MFKSERNDSSVGLRAGGGVGGLAGRVDDARYGQTST